MTLMHDGAFDLLPMSFAAASRAKVVSQAFEDLGNTLGELIGSGGEVNAERRALEQHLLEAYLCAQRCVVKGRQFTAEEVR